MTLQEYKKREKAKKFTSRLLSKVKITGAYDVETFDLGSPYNQEEPKIIIRTD